MKKRFLSLFLALSLTVVMIGCSNSANHSEEVLDESANYEESADSEKESTDDETEENAAIENEVVEKDEVEEPDEAKETKEGIVAEETIKESGEDELSGIILLQSDSQTNYHVEEFTISTVNPTTGHTSKIAHFVTDTISFSPERTEAYILPAQREKGATGNRRQLFSSDFSKMAVDKCYIKEDIRHVGWINTNGIFFDISESVGDLPQSDFADPRHFLSMGFTPDDLFQYCEAFNPQFDGGYGRFKTYYVTPDNLSQSQEGVPFRSAYLNCKDTDTWNEFSLGTVQN